MASRNIKGAMYMLIENLLSGFIYELVQGKLDVKVSSLANDSRKVLPGTLFFCKKGENYDGHRFIDEAIKKGAIGLVIEDDIFVNNTEITVIKVKDTKVALSYMINIFYNTPSQKLNVVGITGTNGKTSISFLIAEILQHIQKNVGVIGTIGLQINNLPMNLEKNTPTTPDSLELHYILNEMLKREVSDVVMEVTSIALDQHRVDDCKIEIGVFTNLTEDHLDYHETMQSYQEAKKKLFDLCNVGIINIDDIAGRAYAEHMKTKTNSTVITYGINENAILNARNIVLSTTGSSFDINIDNRKHTVKTNLPGKFNIYNVLAAIATTLHLGVPIEVIIKTLETIKGARGRFESIVAPSGYSAVVDYAHTPDALENVLKTAREFKPNKLITVFGCGGDRDVTKRPKMGKISSELSDITILTSDNPRSEVPSRIIKDIEKGINNGVYKIIENREEAIKEALRLARNGDLVIIAGKGHETYQINKDETIHFDDMEFIEKYMK